MSIRNEKGDTMKLGIIGAMTLEVEALQYKILDMKVTKRAGRTFCEGVLQGLPVVVVVCGVGKVNAALCVQLLRDLFDVTHILNTGIAGSLEAPKNTIPLLEDLEEMRRHFRSGKLPVTRAEFETRAVLFTILIDLEYLLLAKKKFAEDLTPWQISYFWGTKSRLTVQ